MELHEALEKYIRLYYSDWLGCSRRWCSMLGIPQEAYDLLADVLESLCRKPESKLQDMIAHEEADDRKLFFYVRRAIRLQILEYRTRKYRQVCSVDLLPHLQRADEQQETSDEMFSDFREVEAKMRADDFVDPRCVFNGRGRIYRCVAAVSVAGNLRLAVRYDAVTTKGLHRQFGRHSSAVAFLAGQNTPPRKVVRERLKTALYTLFRIPNLPT